MASATFTTTRDLAPDAKLIDVWITKYALTEGITKKTVEKCNNDDMVMYGWSYFHPGQWYTDRALAVIKAEDMRKRKIASIKKQLARLEAMTFE